MSDTTSRRVIVEGRVQGVGFRAFVEREAIRRRLAGWVRNRRDGSVEAAFTGPAQVVEQMIEACRRGPPSSRVDSLIEMEANGSDLAQSSASAHFVVLPTA
jgi:acylphosphatase